MPSYRVKLRGAPKIIQIEAATFEETTGNEPLDPCNRIAKDANGKEIAWFDGKEITGWWIEPEDLSLAEERRVARERVQAKEE
jgi:hypothetical protein